MDEVAVTFKLNSGADGIDNDPRNPLSRALRSPLVQGRPYKGHSLYFYQAENLLGDTGNALRWLGVLVLSDGDRVIFFPGLSSPIDWIQTSTGTVQFPKRRFDLDHVSLTVKQREWHLTSPGSTDHLSGGRTPNIGYDRVLWFGLSIASEDILREVRNTTQVIFSTPPSDAERRSKLIRDAEQTASHHLVSLMEGAKDGSNEGFLHFTFVVGPAGAPIYTGSDLLVPLGSPNLREPFPPEPSALPVRSHRISVAGDIDVQIVCSWLPGQILVPAVFTTQATLQA